MALNSTAKAKFKIVSYTGEDPDYPVTELLTTSPNSKGWQSARFCDYPQEIIIQFLSPVRIRQIQFLSHQCKIASRIELFSFIQDSITPNNDLRWIKLGFLSLDPNERSNFQSRELKSVFLDAPCLQLKMHFHKCHMNRYNLFNQVGLIALSVYGDLIVNESYDRVSRAQIKYEKLGVSSNSYDRAILEKLTQLEEAKERAVDVEDYKEAKRLKNAIEKIRYIASQIAELESRKVLAIQDEDYDAATVFKQEIDKLRAMIQSSEVQRHSEDLDKSRGDIQNNNILPDEDSHEPEEHKKNDITHNGEHDESGFKKDVTPSYEDQVIPALRGKQTGQPADIENVEDPFGEKNKPVPVAVEKVSDENTKQLEALTPILGEELVKKLVSKLWMEKVDGLKTLNEELKKGQSTKINTSDQGALFIAGMAVVGVATLDNILQINQNGMNVLQSLLNSQAKLNSRGDLGTYLDQVTSGLLEKIGDNNHRIREHAHACYLLMCKNANITCNYCVLQIIKNTGYGKHKITNSIRHTVGKLALLKEVIKLYGINNAEVPYSPIVEYVVANVENSNAEIRNLAFGLTVDIYHKVGDKLRDNLMDLRQAQREALEREFKGEKKKDGRTHSKSPEPKKK